MRCEECGKEAPPDARGWRAVRTDTEDDADSPVGFYCPDCAEREFGTARK
jgi:hypothetical protein